jgi:hypothetical protein
MALPGRVLGCREDIWRGSVGESGKSSVEPFPKTGKSEESSVF